MAKRFDDEKIRFLIEHSTDVIALVESDGRVSYVSASIARVLGYSPEEFINFEAFEVVHPDDRPGAMKRLSELIGTPGKVQTVLNRVRHKDGSWRWIETVSTNHLDEPEVGALVANFRDVTERKQSEEAIRQAEERFRFIVESAQDFAIFTMDMQGRITSWNSGAERILGYGDEEILGQHVRVIFTPEAIEHGRPEQEMSDALSQGRGEDERYHVRKDGSRFWASGLMMPLRDDSGAVRGFLKIMRDLSDYKRAKEQLRTSEERFRLLVEGAHDYVIFMLSPEGLVNTWNRGAERINGYRSEDVVGRHFSMFYTPEDREEGRPESALRQAVEGRSFREEQWQVRKDGSRFRASVFITALRDEDGELLGFANMTHDDTERWRHEEELTASDHRKDQFLAMLAHELRNPLNAVNGAMQLMRTSAAEQHRDWAYEVIERQLRHLTHMMDDLLDVSRVKTGRIELKREPLDASTAVRRALETTHQLIKEQGHELSVYYGPVPLRVEADPTRLEQIVVNLLTNAAKYTEKGGRIWVDATREGDEVVITVRDNGHGMSPEVLPHIFEPFTQAERTLDRSQGGLGIGLALVRQLVELHGGTVTAASPGLGFGAEFTVRLPAVVNPAEEQQGPQGGPTRSEAKGARILVVDDNEDSTRAIARFLQAAGHEVWTAFDGKAAIEAAWAHRPDVVLLDIGLPLMDGYQVAAILRREEAFKETLIVAASGYGQDQDRRKSKEAGFDHHLTKPIDLAEFFEVISQFQDNRAS